MIVQAVYEDGFQQVKTIDLKTIFSQVTAEEFQQTEVDPDKYIQILRKCATDAEDMLYLLQQTDEVKLSVFSQLFQKSLEYINNPTFDVEPEVGSVVKRAMKLQKGVERFAISLLTANFAFLVIGAVTGGWYIWLPVSFFGALTLISAIVALRSK